MAHAVSLTYARFDHMSATAMAMTTLLHAVVAFALWWASPLRPIDPFDDAVSVTMEQERQPAQILPSEIPATPPLPDPPPQAAAPAPPPAPPSTPAPAPPVRMGLAPVGPAAEKEADPGVERPRPPTAQTPDDEATRPDPPKTETPSDTAILPDPLKPEAPKEEQQLALATPPPPPPPPPSLEQALPPVEAPPPPVTSREIPAPPPPAVKAPPPPPSLPQRQPQPTQRVQPAPRPAPPQQVLQSSPLSHLPQARTPAEQQASRQAPTFQNPADMHGIRRAESEYLWFIARKVSQHQEFVGNATTDSGTVELRLTIARNGQLLNVVVSRSSGLPSLDRTSVNIIRQAGPYGPLPPEITGAQHTFTLPLYFRRN